MSKLKRKLIAVLAVLFCALLALSAALIIPKIKTVEAYISEPSVTVGELYSSSTNGFSAKNLRALYGKLVQDAKKLDDINTALSNSSGANGNSGEMVIANKNIIVEFGGKKWLAVYLSKATTANAGTDAPAKGKATNNDVVLTLLLAYSNEYSLWNAYMNNNDGNYPSSMYGTSKIRSVVLGNGGQYATDISGNFATPLDLDISNSSFSEFTIGDLKDYLVSPRYIGWQFSQHSRWNGSSGASPKFSYNLNNEAWGTVGSTSFSQGICFEGRDKYDAWKDDLVWLPSVAEMGYPISATDQNTYGLWKVSQSQRACQDAASGYDAWTRTSFGDDPNVGMSNFYTALYTQGGWFDGANGNRARPVSSVTTTAGQLVRPAIHLNLTEAAKAAKGISYDAVDVTNEQNGTAVTNTQTTHTFSRVYDDTELKVNLLDNDYLDVVGPYVGNNEAQSEAQYQNGVFSATKPKTDDDETYIIKVTPKTENGKSYVWDDTDQGGDRYYKITIKAATINANWSNFGASNGESVLQNLQVNPITSETISSGVTFVDKYKIVTNSSDYLPADSSQWNTSGWKGRSTGDPDFTITQAVTYRVYYEITATYHKPKRGFYDVTVNSDLVTFTAKSSDAVSTETYASNGAKNLTKQTTLIELFRENVSMAGKDGALDRDSIEYIMTRVDVKLYKLVSGNRTNIDFAENDILPAGDYYLYIEWNVDSEYRTFGFNWDASTYIKFTIDPKPITVQIVAEDGGELTHVYGDDEVELTYYVDESDLVGEDTIAALKLGSIFIEGTTNTRISSETVVGTYNLTGKQTGTSNYKVTFDDCSYEVTKRPVSLKLENEKMEYGKDFASFTFKAPTISSGNLVNGDKLSDVIKSRNYYLELHGTDVDETDLYIETYELLAKFEADNYEFTVDAGATFEVTKANYDMSGVSLISKGYVYDGQPHAAQISGTLPDGVTVSYRYVNTADGRESTDPPVEIGLYLVYASFTHTDENYNGIADKVAYIRIAATQAEANQPFPSLPSDEELEEAAQLAQKKQEAKKSLDEEANKKKAEIDGNEELTDEEKAAAKSEVDKELEKGNAAIDSANNVSDVNTAFNQGKANIENIKGIHKEDSSFPWWIIALIGGALLLLVMLIIIIVKRRQTADGEDEYDDYYDDEYYGDEEEYSEEYEDDGYEDY